MKFEDILDFFKNASFDSIYLDLDRIKEKEKILVLYIILAEKFNFICKVEGNIYKFDTNIRKGILLNLLRGKTISELSKFDEIYMPLPKDAELFLDSAFKCANKDATIHMYDFLHENEFPQKSENAIKEAAKRLNKKVKILQTRKVGQYSPRKYRVCCDFTIL